MFIVWGKKLVYKKLGYVADFCPICRVPSAFHLRRVGMANHVYYATIGQGELVAYERTCQECRTPIQSDQNYYAPVAKKRAPVADLIRATFPNLTEVLKDRLALEDRVRRSSLSATEREALLRSPFHLLSQKVEARFAQWHFTWEVGVALVAAIAITFFGPGLLGALTSDEPEMVVLACILLSVGVVIWQIIESGRRWMRKEILPALSKSLRPLRPSESEIGTVIGEMKQAKLKMGSKLKAAELMERIRSPETLGV
jgi:hypothetical protein